MVCTLQEEREKGIDMIVVSEKSAGNDANKCLSNTSDANTEGSICGYFTCRFMNDYDIYRVWMFPFINVK